MTSTDRPEILLVNPHGWRFIGDGTIPSGLLAVAAPLLDRYRVTIVDQRVDLRWRRSVSQALARRPVLVGITCMTGKQIKDAIGIASYVRDHDVGVGVPLVWGGVHPSLLPEQTLEHSCVDYVVQGEGEDTLSELADALREGRDVRGIPGLWHCLDGAPASVGAREELAAERLPRLPYELLDLERYVRRDRFGRTISIFSSRGCPFRCAFCYNVAFFNGARWKPIEAERVVAEVLELVRRHDLGHVQFLDDNFFVNRDRVRAIAEGIAASDTPVQWSVLGAHVKNLSKWSPAELARLRECGLREVLVGAESGSQRVLDSMQKDYDLEDLFRVNRWLGDADIQPTYSFISGVPGETEVELRETIRTMFQLKRDHPNAIMGNIKPFLPYPGTELGVVAKEVGFDPPASLEEWASFASYDYGRVRIRWLSTREKRRLIWLYYATVLLSPEYLFIRSPLFRFVCRLAAAPMRRHVERFDFGNAYMPRLMRFVQAHVL